MRYWAELRKQPVVVSGSSSGPKVADGREEKGWGGRELSLTAFREPRLLAVCPGAYSKSRRGAGVGGRTSRLHRGGRDCLRQPCRPALLPWNRTGGAALFCFLPESPVLPQLVEEGTGKGTGPAGRGGNGMGEGWNRVSKGAEARPCERDQFRGKC